MPSLAKSSLMLTPVASLCVFPAFVDNSNSTRMPFLSYNTPSFSLKPDCSNNFLAYSISCGWPFAMSPFKKILVILSAVYNGWPTPERTFKTRLSLSIAQSMAFLKFSSQNHICFFGSR